jgi:hypothetical protein
VYRLTALVRSPSYQLAVQILTFIIGTQTHLSGGMGANTRGVLDQLASAAVTEIAITELDIANSPTSDYTAVVNACWAVTKCWGITVWGISDKVSAGAFLLTFVQFKRDAELLTTC